MKKSKQGETMTYAVAINSSGQATIPKAVRDLLGIIPGENRLTFDIKDKKVILGKEKSRREQLLASLDKIHKILEKAERENPKIKEAKEKYQNMSFEEIRDAYDDTPEGKKEFEEKYGIKL